MPLILTVWTGQTKIPALEFGSEVYMWAEERWGDINVEWIKQAVSCVQSVDQDYNNQQLTCHHYQSLANTAWRIEIMTEYSFDYPQAQGEIRFRCLGFCYFVSSRETCNVLETDLQTGPAYF